MSSTLFFEDKNEPNKNQKTQCQTTSCTCFFSGLVELAVAFPNICISYRTAAHLLYMYAYEGMC